MPSYERYGRLSIARPAMVIDRRKVVLYGAASFLRLALFAGFPSLPVLLTGRVEISTPVTSFKRCMFATGRIRVFLEVIIDMATVQEGLFLYSHNVSPYDGGVFYQVSNMSPKYSFHYPANYL